MFAKIINEQIKQCDVFLGTDTIWAEQQGFSEMEVEQAYDGAWYVQGYAPVKPQPSYDEMRAAEYPSIQEQLDMIYWDNINGTTKWMDKIAEIKAKYPKGEIQTEESNDR